jgi:uncharacterized protein YaaW (UPF0174 family)
MADLFNKDELKITIAKHDKLVNIYNSNLNKLEEEQNGLNDLRNKSSNEIFKIVANYINSLANSPKEFDNSYSKLKQELSVFFDENINFEQLEKEATNECVNKVSGGALAGIGIGALGPVALTTAVSTFGTASTGVAISSLSGAAATNATVAWIGGGSIASGGAGIAGGKALLALAGPIGWAVAGGFALKAGIDYSNKNKKIIAEANEKIDQLKEKNENCNYRIRNTTNTIEQTKTYFDEILKLVIKLKNNAPKNYLEFNQHQEKELTALINNVNSFSKLLNTSV